METAVPAAREMPRKVGLGPPLRQRPMPTEGARPPAPPVSVAPTLQRITQARPAEPLEPRPQPAPAPGPTQMVSLIVPDPPAPKHQHGPTAPLLPANPLHLSAAEQPVQRTSAPNTAPRDRAQPDPVAAALSTGLARLDADGAVVFTALAPPAPQPAAPPTPTPTIQRTTVTSPSPPTTGTEAKPKPSTPTSAELDELAARLYDRIRTRMKAELRVDRERAGLVAGPYR